MNTPDNNQQRMNAHIYQQSFRYDSKKQAHIGKRTGQHFIRYKHNNNYDGFPRFSDYFQKRQSIDGLIASSSRLTQQCINKQIINDMDMDANNKQIDNDSRIINPQKHDICFKYKNTGNSIQKQQQTTSQSLMIIENSQNAFQTNISPIPIKADIINNRLQYKNSNKTVQSILSKLQYKIKQKDTQNNSQDQYVYQKNKQYSFGNNQYQRCSENSNCYSFRQNNNLEQQNTIFSGSVYRNRDIVECCRYGDSKYQQLQLQVSSQQSCNPNNTHQIQKQSIKKYQTIKNNNQFHNHTNSTYFTPQFQINTISNLYYVEFIKNNYNFNKLIGVKNSCYDIMFTMDFCTALITAHIKLPPKKSIECMGLGSCIDVIHELQKYWIDLWITKGTVILDYRNQQIMMKKQVIYLIKEYQPFQLINRSNCLTNVYIKICSL